MKTALPANICSLLVECLTANCLRGTFSGREIRLLSVPEWLELLTLAQQLGVAPLAYRQIRDLPDIPLVVQEKFRRSYLGNIYRNTQMFDVLAEVLSVLHQHGIRVIVLKGAYLAEIVYGDMGLRTMSDMDILIPRDQLPLAVRCLFALGFCLSPDSPQHQLDEYNIPPSFNHYPTLIHQETHLHLDVHCSLLYENSPFTLDMEGVWERVQPAVINGENAFVLSPEDLLLHLCIHTAFLNLFTAGVRGLYDIREVVRHFGQVIDWEKLTARAAQWRALKCVSLTLYLADKLMDAQIPHSPLINHSQYAPHWLEQAQGQLFLTSSGLEFLPSRYANLGRQTSLKARLRAIIKTLFPHRKYMAVMFGIPANSWLIYTCYPRRVTRYAAKVWRKFCQERSGLSAVIKQDQASFHLKQWLAED